MWAHSPGHELFLKAPSDVVYYDLLNHSLFISRGHSTQIIHWPGFPFVPYKTLLFESHSTSLSHVLFQSVSQTVECYGKCTRLRVSYSNARLCGTQQVTSSDLASAPSSARWGDIPFLGYGAVAVQMKWDGECEIVLQIIKPGIFLFLCLTFLTQTQRQQWFCCFFFSREGCIKVLRKSIIQLLDLPKDLLMFNLNSPLSHSDLIYLTI